MKPNSLFSLWSCLIRLYLECVPNGNWLLRAPTGDPVGRLAVAAVVASGLTKRAAINRKSADEPN
jgi:hypothetical protein